MTTLTLYLTRIALMLLVALPLTAAAMTAVELAGGSQRIEGPASLFAGALLLTYIWGGLTAIPVSLLHTAISRAFRMKPPMVFGLAVLLAIAGGAVTPTILTGLWSAYTMLWAGLVGALYGLAAILAQRAEANRVGQ